MFGLDATASRQPTWDLACDLQSQMFLEAALLGGLDVQLIYFRGFRECRASRWVDRPADLVKMMTKVQCQAGRTQIERVLHHAISQAKKRGVDALVYVGDCCEEDVDRLGHLAGELGSLGVRAFVFQEGADAKARLAFQNIASLTKGAYCSFSAHSPGELRDLLRAVAAYAAGGVAALENVNAKLRRPVRLLTKS